MIINNQVQVVQNMQSNLDDYKPDNNSLGGAKYATIEYKTYKNLFEWLNPKSRNLIPMYC